MRTKLEELFITKTIEHIESWFRTYEDGEFSVLPHEHASLRTGEGMTSTAIVYLTKPNQAKRCRRLAIWPEDAAVVGRYGLPLFEDVTYLQSFQWEVNFVGDADPVDLLVFAWLREHLSIRWLGVSDTFLQSQGVQVCPWMQMPLSSSEQAAILQLPEYCPDFRVLLGDKCAAVLEAGMKIELEATLLSD